MRKRTLNIQDETRWRASDAAARWLAKHDRKGKRHRHHDRAEQTHAATRHSTMEMEGQAPADRRAVVSSHVRGARRHSSGDRR
jgi:hypothetical protein